MGKFFATLTVLLVLGSASFAAPGALTPMERLLSLTSKPLLVACCKVCSKGKACGDSCISRNKQCHKGQGCAC